MQSGRSLPRRQAGADGFVAARGDLTPLALVCRGPWTVDRGLILCLTLIRLYFPLTNHRHNKPL